MQGIGAIEVAVGLDDQAVPEAVHDNEGLGHAARVPPHLASLMIAAGVNAKALSTFMGHAKIGITLDHYGHLMPGSDGEAAALLDTYLTAQREQAEAAARQAEPAYSQTADRRSAAMSRK